MVAPNELLALQLEARRGRSVVGLEPLLDSAALVRVAVYLSRQGGQTVEGGMAWPRKEGVTYVGQAPRATKSAHRADGVDHDLGRDRAHVLAVSPERSEITGRREDSLVAAVGGGGGGRVAATRGVATPGSDRAVLLERGKLVRHR